MIIHNCLLQKETSKNVPFEYLLYLSEDYGIESNKKWPLILFLHGRGCVGGELDKIKSIGLPKAVEDKKTFPFIILAPLCPEQTWLQHEEELISVLEEAVTKYSVDETRIYLTGQSMGGICTWHIAARHPKRFSAIAPICGGGTKENITQFLKDTPTWVFHGDQDQLVPWTESQRMVDELKSIGGNVKFTLYPGVMHNCWVNTYNNPELYEWFLQHNLKLHM